MNDGSKFVKTIWASYKGVFEKKVSHLNKILRRHGKPEIKYTFTNKRAVPVSFTCHVKGDAFANDDTYDVLVEMYDVVCEGLTVVKKDDKTYEFIGTVRYEDGIKQTFVKNEEYARFFTEDFREGMCDHCGTKRMNRKAYYMFLTDDGKVLQIGSSCAKEFFGIKSTDFLNAQGNTFLVDYSGDDDMEEYRKRNFCATYSEIFHAVDFATRGFTHWNKSANGRFIDHMIPFLDNGSTAIAKCVCMADPTEEGEWTGYVGNMGFVTREECKKYWDEVYSQRMDSFSYNCSQALECDFANETSFGSYCYAIFGAVNAKYKKMLAEKAAGEAVPCPYEKGTRADITATVLSVRQIECEVCYDGYHDGLQEVTSINAKGANGELYHFTTSANGFRKLSENDIIVFRAKIEEAKSYDGKMYTRVSRPRLLNVNGSAAA